MNWFIAKLVFAIHHQPNHTTTQFDEHIRLVSAHNKLEALIKARMLGIKEEHTFTNEKLVEVNWSFIDVIELHLIEAFIDGMELHSNVREDSSVSYIDYIKHRGQLLVNDIEQSSKQVGV